MDTNFESNTETFIDGGGVVERDTWKQMGTRFYTDVAELVDREGTLVRAELNEKATQVKGAAVSLVGGAICMNIGVHCLAATCIIMLAYAMPLWLSAVLVTAVFLIVGGIMLMAAKKKLNANDLKPTKSIEAFDHIRFSLKEKVNEITKH
jgi:undecaprenyl pyrophosphate phosphatase UppP